MLRKTSLLVRRRTVEGWDQSTQKIIDLNKIKKNIKKNNQINLTVLKN